MFPGVGLGQNYPVCYRQFYCPQLLASSRGHQELLSTPANLPILRSSSRSQHDISLPSHTGPEKCPSRPTVTQEPGRPHGVDPVRPSSGHSVEAMATAQVDTFATCLNHRLPQYFSPVVDLKVLGMDRLSQNWQNLSLYRFPPGPLTPWYPKLLKLAQRPGTEILQLPQRDDLVAQPLSGTLMSNVQSRNFHVLRLLKSAGKSEAAQTPS